MYEMFCNEKTKEGRPQCSLSKYKKVFYKYFNLGFGNPHSDTCSTCKMYQIEIEKEKENLEKLQSVKTQRKVHQMRAKKFHQIMNKPENTVIDIVFDLQQNQPLPKLSIGEIFYSRQVWLYNLAIMIHKKKQNKSNIHFYTWLETQSGRGANEVASCIIDFLFKLEEQIQLESKEAQYYKIRLFSDSCASQNKNTILMTAIMYFLETSSVFIEIQHLFPIRGHSYMPPDRVFGRLEKEYRKKEDIIAPSEYHTIMEKYGIVKNMFTDWKLFDIKREARKIFKCRLPFKMGAARIFSYKKENDKVQFSFSNTYTGSLVTVEPLKRNIRRVSDRINEWTSLSSKNNVSEAKKEDVEKLMKFFVIPQDAQNFYNDILAANTKENTSAVQKVYCYDEES